MRTIVPLQNWELPNIWQILRHLKNNWSSIVFVIVANITIRPTAKRMILPAEK